MIARLKLDHLWCGVITTIQNAETRGHEYVLLPESRFPELANKDVLAKTINRLIETYGYTLFMQDETLGVYFFKNGGSECLDKLLLSQKCQRLN